MTAVAAPPILPSLNRPGWISGRANSLNTDDVSKGASMFMPRKTMQRTNSSSSIASNSSNSSTSTVTSTASANSKSMATGGDAGGWSSGAPRKRPQTKAQWTGSKSDGQADFQRAPINRPSLANGANGQAPMHQPSPILQSPGPGASANGASRPSAENNGPPRPQSFLFLTSLNGTFERKTISVPYYPDTLRIGRQTNAKTVPTSINGFFDSKVLSRQHAEIWADNNGKIYIRDVKSSNGTFVNGNRLSQENRESEPHELVAGDRLELGIDIVSEDQKTVVHHKVAAKVEHSGYVSASSNMLEMSLADLDASMGGMMMMPFGGMQARGRYGNQAVALVQPNGRPIPPNMMAFQPNVMQQRQFWLNPPTVDNIIKRLHSEMRNAKLQHQDLQRTQHFMDTLLSQHDIKDRADAPEAVKNHVNGASLSFRSDGGKTRFSDPPAPPPSQPLPEKPDVVRPHPDVPAPKRATTERPKSNASNASPKSHDSHHLQLMEMLSSARKEADRHSATVRTLQQMLMKEREAREFAEEKIRKWERSIDKLGVVAMAPLANVSSELERAFEPPAERPLTPETCCARPEEYVRDHAIQLNQFEASAVAFEARMDSMVSEMKGLREQLEAYKQRAERAEAERESDGKTLAELVLEINRRNEKDMMREAERTSRSLSRSRSRSKSRGRRAGQAKATENGAVVSKETAAPAGGSSQESPEGFPILSRPGSTTPTPGALSKASQDQVAMAALPYASMLGVVLLGVGLMAYLNGWQPRPRLDQ